MISFFSFLVFVHDISYYERYFLGLRDEEATELRTATASLEVHWCWQFQLLVFTFSPTPLVDLQSFQSYFQYMHVKKSQSKLFES